MCNPPSSYLDALRLGRGDSTPASGALRAYLRHFGWLRQPAAETEPAGDGDDVIQAALADFQLFHRLAVSGTADDETVALMCRQRCPLPDRPGARSSGAACVRAAPHAGGAHEEQASVRDAWRTACATWRQAAAIEIHHAMLDNAAWAPATPHAGVDLVTLALHDVGHALGLDHSSYPECVMYAYFTDARRTLARGDIAAIQLLYGRPGR